MRRKAWIGLLLTGLGFAQQYYYTAFFQHAYQRAVAPNVPDSLDIYLCISRSTNGTNPDTLASSNFPFFYNTAALNFGSARILYRNKFHNNNYYAPLTYTVSGGRVNVTVQRKINYTPPGHTLDGLDTIIGFRVPLYACGPQVNTPLVWDSVPAAVLNSQLQSMKDRLRWANDTVPLCPPLSGTLSLTSPPSPICPETPATFSFTLSGALLPDSFVVRTWQTGPNPGPPVIHGNLVSQTGGSYTFSLTFPAAGSYTMEIIGIDKKCLCEIPLLTQNLTVSSLSPLTREFYGLQTPVCVGDTVALSAEGSGVWITLNGSGSFTDPTDPMAQYITSPSDPNQVSICWVIRAQDTTLCRDRSKDTICRTLTINPTDAVGRFSIGSRSVCFGGRVQLTGQIIQGSDGFWFSDGTGSFSPSSTVPNAFYVPGVGDVGRWVHITWIVRGATCGFATYEDSVFVEPGTELRISAPNQVCEGIGLALSALPTAPGILWFQGSAGSVLASGGYNQTNPRFRKQGPYYEVGILPVGRDTFTAYLQQGSCESIAEFPLEVIASPTAYFTAAPTVTTMNNPRIRFISQSQGAISYTWDFGDFTKLSTDSTQTVVEHIYSAPGTYSVVLYVENRLGCSDVYVCTNCIQILPRRVYLPNAFSPNGDGQNDAFRVLPVEEGFRFTRLEVFDRWGQMVFAGDNISEWKGEGKDGQPLDAGAYSYRAVILLPDEGLFTYTGVVHIVR